MGRKTEDMFRTISPLKNKLISLSERKKLLLTLIIIVVSVAGFLTQLTQVSTQYFAYQTTTRVKLDSPELINVDNIAVCIRYNDILDVERLYNDTRIQWKEWADLETAIELESLLTVEQIFRYTPKAPGIIEKCSFRPNDWQMLYKNSTDCEKEFRIRRYFMQEYMCYSFRKAFPPTRLYLRAITRSTFNQFVLFEIFLNEKFRRAIRISVTSFDGKDIPYESRDYSASLYLDSLADPKANYLEILSSDFVIEQLEAPFDTRCTKCHMISCLTYSCRSECIQSALAKVNKVSASMITEEPVPLTVMGTLDLRNKTNLQFVRETFHFCTKKCEYNPCIVSYSKTMAFPELYTNASLGFAALTPIDPVIKTVAQARMTGIDYFSFVCACFGTWFGLSCLSLEKALLILTEKKKMQQDSGNTILVSVWDKERKVRRILRIA